MSAFDLDKSINHTIAYAATLMKRQLFSLFKKNNLEITPDQWVVLYYLWQQDGLNFGELAEKTKKDNANITRIINRLEKQNLVKKVNRKDDKRFYNVYLTDNANNTKDKVYGSILTSTDICSNSLSIEEQTILLKLLNKLIANMKNHAALQN